MTVRRLPMSPPRAERALPPSILPMYEGRRWGQAKFNGTYSVLTKSMDRDLFALTRHGVPHKMWDWTEGSRAFFDAYVPPGASVCAELLHSKVTGGPRDVHVIHDVLMWEGKLLHGTTYRSRWELVGQMFGGLVEDETPWHWVLGEHAWMARNITQGLPAAFAALDKPWHEGLVLKDPDGVLSMSSNDSWTVKVRRKHKNFSF